MKETIPLSTEDPREDLSWQDDAACGSADPETFFPPSGGRNAAEPAKLICNTCIVRVDCLQYALEHDERFGVWGGMSEDERSAIRQGRLNV